VKYHIDTIPIWDTYKEDCECPLCLIRERNEHILAEDFLGDSVMEPDTRIATNKQGFCQRHLHIMFDMQVRHPLALMLQTHAREAYGAAAKDIAELRRAIGVQKGKAAPVRITQALMKNGADAEAARKTAEKLEKAHHSCILCDRLEDRMHRYALTIGQLWCAEEEFRETFAKSRGFCQPHFAQMLTVIDRLPVGQRQKFLAALLDVQEANLERMQKELDWYVEKMDYNKRDLPWGTSRDALTRALTKTRGSTYKD